MWIPAHLCCRWHVQCRAAATHRLGGFCLSHWGFLLKCSYRKDMLGSRRKRTSSGSPATTWFQGYRDTTSQHISTPEMLTKIKQQISLTMHQPAKGYCVTGYWNINPAIKLANILCSTSLLRFLWMKHYFSSMFSTWKEARKTSITTSDLLIP